MHSAPEILAPSVKMGKTIMRERLAETFVGMEVVSNCKCGDLVTCENVIFAILFTVHGDQYTKVSLLDRFIIAQVVFNVIIALRMDMGISFVWQFHRHCLIYKG